MPDLGYVSDRHTCGGGNFAPDIKPFLHDVLRHLGERMIRAASEAEAEFERWNKVYGDTLNKRKVRDVSRLIMADEEEGRINMGLADDIPVKTRCQLPDPDVLPCFITDILDMSFSGHGGRC